MSRKSRWSNYNRFDLQAKEQRTYDARGKKKSTTRAYTTKLCICEETCEWSIQQDIIELAWSAFRTNPDNAAPSFVAAFSGLLFVPSNNLIASPCWIDKINRQIPIKNFRWLGESFMERRMEGCKQALSLSSSVPLSAGVMFFPILSLQVDSGFLGWKTSFENVLKNFSLSSYRGCPCCITTL